jgi:hypothetical protein
MTSGPAKAGARRFIAAGMALALALAVAGCSGGGGAQDGQSVLLSALGERAVSAVRPGAEDPAALPRLRPGQRVRVDPSMIAGVTVPVLLAHLEDRGTVATLGRVAVNDGVATWRGADPITLALRADGLLVGTRGLGPDLMIADVAGTEAALRQGTGAAVTRVHRFLDGDLQLRSVTYSCTLVPAGREDITIAGRTHTTLRFDERCSSLADGRETFVNSYWRATDRMFVWQSRQWISEALGVMNAQRLVE